MAAIAEDLSPLEEQRLQRDWKLFEWHTLLFMFGFAMYGGVFQNFLRDVYGAGPIGLGQLESIREVPGLLAALTAGTLAAWAESRVSGLGLLITALGIGLSGLMPSYAALVGITVFWSVGFHLWSAVNSAVTLSLARGKEGGRHLGRMSGLSAMATIVGLGAALLGSKLLPPGSYQPFFLLSGCAIAVAGVLCLMLSRHASSVQRSRLVLRREYGLYYLLMFLEGCRRQIFSIFASFALILVYKVPLSTMLALQFTNAILIALTAPRIGKLMDRTGERGPLSFYAVALIVVFLGYATFESAWALAALFLIDNVLFSFSVGFTTYLHRIVRPGEMTPCLSMGVTMNHVAAVTVPWAGAVLWERTHNYQLPFWVGVAIAAVSFGITRLLPTQPAPASPVSP